MEGKTISAAIIGSGSRGSNFGDLMQKTGGKFKITAVCDTDPEQLKKTKNMLNLSDDILFDDEEEFFKEKRAEVLVIATPDKLHVRQSIRAMHMGYDILVEKPLTDSEEELKALLKAKEETNRTVVVCHELRYAPAFVKLSELLEEGVVGDLLAIDAMERLVYWHQAQAYVRLQSQYFDLAYPTIFAKCSHDLDLIQYYAGAECDTVSSIGGLSFFRKENAPQGAAERCLDCHYVEKCPYSAKKIYIDNFIKDGRPEWVWPYNKVSLKKPLKEEDIYEGLRTKCFGKCVFMCGVEKDEHVVDHQMVQMNFKNGVIATLKMVFSGAAGRRYNFFGTRGEILMDDRNGTIEVYRYGEEKEVISVDSLIEAGYSHGGGDQILIDRLYSILNNECENRTSLRESAESHLMGIAAEKSRLSGGKTVKINR